MLRSSTQNSANLMSTILQGLPPEAEIVRVEYEGPRIALYSRNPKFLLQNSQLISEMVKNVKKRIVLRTDKAIRKSEDEARSMMTSALPPEAEVAGIFFDDALGEAVIEAGRPLLLSAEQGFDIPSLTEKSGWRIRIRKASHIHSSSMMMVYQTLKSSSDERERLLKEIGECVFRPRLAMNGEVTIKTLGAFEEVGRSSILVETSQSKLLLDCGIHPGARNPLDAFPRLDWTNLSLDELDGVIISHSHLDHIGFLPVLFKYGYDGPVYCSEPTLPMMVLLLSDYVKIASMEGRNLLYDLRDVREIVKHAVTLPYGLVTDLSPDLKLVLSNAGHILGSSSVHLHIGDGVHNLVYSGDFKYGPSMLFESAFVNFPRVETLIVESTYGAKEDIMPSREEVEAAFVSSLNETLQAGGKVLIPVPAVGRAQEIMLVIDQYMKMGRLTEVPVFIEGMISEATAIHIAHPDYLARDLRARILEANEDPFKSDYFTVIEHPSNRGEAISGGPAIIMATSGMLEGGPVLQYFEELAPSELNKILFVSYQVNGTTGRRILDGATQVNMMSDNGKIKIVDVKAKVERVEGFSGHSDYNQIMKYIARLRPMLQQVIVNHGEKRKVRNVASAVSRLFKLPGYHPSTQEAIRIH